MTDTQGAPLDDGARHNPADPAAPTLRLLSSLNTWHTGETSPVADGEVVVRGEINADAAVLEQAKGALMLRYGISSYLAFAALLRWAHEADTTLDTIARTLVHDICQGEQTEPGGPSLARWLEDQLRHNLPEDAWTT